MENLRFDKEGYFHVLVFYKGYFINEIENISPLFPYRYRNTRGSLGELEIAWKHWPYRLVFPLQFLVLLNIHSRVSITVWKHGKCFLFLKNITHM